MKKYILTKTSKGKKFLYEVKDENGNIVSKRTSTRDYVACTVNSEFYFGRLELIWKGEHGREFQQLSDLLNNPKGFYEKIVKSFVPSYRGKWKMENPFNEWYNAFNIEDCKKRKNELQTIAYLQPGE